MVCRCAYYWSEICVFNAFEDIQVPCYNVKQPEIFYKLLNRRMASLIYIKIWRQFVTPSQNTPNFACYEKRAFRYAFDARSVLKYFLRLRSVFLNAEVSEMTNLHVDSFLAFQTSLRTFPCIFATATEFFADILFTEQYVFEQFVNLFRIYVSLKPTSNVLGIAQA